MKVGGDQKQKAITKSHEIMQDVNLADCYALDGTVDTLMLQIEKQRIDLAYDINKLVNNKSKQSNNSRGVDSHKASNQSNSSKSL